MRRITEITDEYQQQHILPIEGTDVRAYLTLEYKPLHFCWNFTLTWGDFEAYNEQVVSTQNLLRQYRNLVPFGIGILTKSGMDPMNLDDFFSGGASLYLMSKTEVDSIEADFYG
jgi:hypothetical protein